MIDQVALARESQNFRYAAVVARLYQILSIAPNGKPSQATEYIYLRPR